MREKKLYRDHLQEVKENFSTELIPINDAAKWLGITKKTMLKHYDVTHIGSRWYITQVALARGLS